MEGEVKKTVSEHWIEKVEIGKCRSEGKSKILLCTEMRMLFKLWLLEVT